MPVIHAHKVRALNLTNLLGHMIPSIVRGVSWSWTIEFLCVALCCYTFYFELRKLANDVCNVFDWESIEV